VTVQVDGPSDHTTEINMTFTPYISPLSFAPDGFWYGDGVGSHDTSRRVKGLTIPLAIGTPNYGDGAKLVREGSPSCCESGKCHVCAPLAASAEKGHLRHVKEMRKKRRACNRERYVSPDPANAEHLDTVKEKYPCSCNLFYPAMDGFHVFGNVPSSLGWERYGLKPNGLACHCGGDKTPFDEKIKRYWLKEEESIHSSLPKGPIDAADCDFEPENRSGNKFACLDSEEELSEMTCTFRKRLRGKARTLVGFFSKELGIKGDKSQIPLRIDCGGVRPAVRRCFPANVPALVELSLKTAQKVEDGCCKACLPRFERLKQTWKEKMSAPVEVDPDHLRRFEEAFRGAPLLS
jgi:hypothetical protein